MFRTIRAAGWISRHALANAPPPSVAMTESANGLRVHLKRARHCEQLSTVAAGSTSNGAVRLGCVGEGFGAVITNNQRSSTFDAVRLSLPAARARLFCTTSARSDEEAKSQNQEHVRRERAFDWITEEAEILIARAYNRHKSLADKSQAYPPALSVKDLEHGLGQPFHYPPKNVVDRMSFGLMQVLRRVVHWFFREKYDHHAVVLETVAAVPGIVASFHRHLRSLRRMKRDHGWINPLQEEAENERMHLLIWMKVCQPSYLERLLVIAAQGAYTLFYMGLYFTSPRAAHRLVGYLEEEAFAAYTLYLEAIDEGKIKNRPAPDIAIEYYRLPADAKLRDVVLHVRADECMHRDFNHALSNSYQAGNVDARPAFLGDDMRERMD